ncbi:hypothetical protein SLEP1_g2949 [Rubroshorea leprosula]|uniref:Uncharacterized protein n=1 Tax=Rubroshorea leprosula TaxID=152421 RepID=A0AAV5HUN1_9ROSI|nr:hypothetical protein SLEP1_g2949 [Rubroshorea leprosula]
MSPEATLKVKEKIKRLLKVGFVETSKYVEWLSNVIPMVKKNGKLRIYAYFSNLNLTTPKDEYSMPIADLLVDDVARHQILSFVDGHNGIQPEVIKGQTLADFLVDHLCLKVKADEKKANPAPIQVANPGVTWIHCSWVREEPKLRWIHLGFLTNPGARWVLQKPKTNLARAWVPDEPSATWVGSSWVHDEPRWTWVPVYNALGASWVETEQRSQSSIKKKKTKNPGLLAGFANPATGFREEPRFGFHEEPRFGFHEPRSWVPHGTPLLGSRRKKAGKEERAEG